MPEPVSHVQFYEYFGIMWTREHIFRVGERGVFFQIVRENILLLIDNIHEKMPIKNRMFRRHLGTKLLHLSIVFLAY